MHKLFILIASITLLSSCAKKRQLVIYENDADTKDWINQNTVENVPNAHSGGNASIVDSIHPYSLGFSKDLEKIGNTPFKEVQFSYWVLYKSDKTKASTVISLDANGKNDFWNNRLVVVKELNRWTEIREVFKLPKNVTSQHKLSLYVWNGSKEEFLIDDLSVTFK